jgi:hypothetical protein
MEFKRGKNWSGFSGQLIRNPFAEAGVLGFSPSESRIRSTHFITIIIMIHLWFLVSTELWLEQMIDRPLSR